jgi:hypothetical protein
MSDALRREVEGLRRLGNTSQPSTKAHQRMLESIFLNGITEFEGLLENVFLAAVSKKIRPGKTKTIVDFHDPNTARSLLLRPRETYLNWMPIEHSLERAGQFLADGVPFSRFGTRPLVKERLRLASAVRNAVAHKGGYARSRFRKLTSGKYRFPGEFLSARLGSGTVCDGFLDDFVRFGQALCVSDAEALKLLGPEGPYRAGTVVDPATYKCLGCGTEYQLGQRGSLSCSICDSPCPTCQVSTSRKAQFRPA